MPLQSVPIHLPDGRTFPSISACARAFGISASTVNYHLNRGTLAKLNKRAVKNNCRPIELDGQNFPSKVAAMSELGISEYELEKRLSRGLS